MSTDRVDPNLPLQPSAPVQKADQPAPSTPFSRVLAGSSNVLISGAQSSAGVVGGTALAAAMREAGGQALGAAVGGAGGSAAGGMALAAAAGGAPGGEIAQMHAMQRESQAFNLQLLNLQQEVQDENRRFTTVSNCIKAAHDTAKSAVQNIHS
jgi:hypothetical protein